MSDKVKLFFAFFREKKGILAEQLYMLPSTHTHTHTHRSASLVLLISDNYLTGAVIKVKVYWLIELQKVESDLVRHSPKKNTKWRYIC